MARAKRSRWKHTTHVQRLQGGARTLHSRRCDLCRKTGLRAALPAEASPGGGGENPCEWSDMSESFSCTSFLHEKLSDISLHSHGFSGASGSHSRASRKARPAVV